MKKERTKTAGTYKARKLIVLIMAVITALSMLPQIKTAGAAEAGDTGIVEYTNVCKDTEGNKYYFNGSHFTSGARERYYLKVDGDKDLYCFCIQFEKNLPGQGKELTAHANSSYWKNLSKKKKQGITLAALYGFGGVSTAFGQKKVNPDIEELAGKVTMDDLWLATQEIIWEYQTGDRKNTGDVQRLVTLVPWNGCRTHESFMTAYKWILSQMKTHRKSWSFASESEKDVPQTLLRWSNDKQAYAAFGVKDSNSIGRGMTNISPSDLVIRTVKEGGDLYDFSTPVYRGSKKIYSMQKDFGGKYSSGDIESALVWNTGSKTDQWMYTGTSDFIDFYAGIKTEPKGKLQFTKYYTAENSETSALTGTKKAKPEKGAVFKVYNTKYDSFEAAAKSRYAESAVMTSDDKGIVKLADDEWLTAGTYRIIQVSGKEENKYLDPFEMEVRTDNETVMADGLFVDDEIKMQLQLVKTDQESGKKVTMSDASFRLRDGNGKLVTQKYYDEEGSLKKISEFRTDSSGTVLLPEPLLTGTYQIEEIKAPDGYLLQKEPLMVEIGRSAENPNTVELVDDTLLRCRFSDRRIKGKIRIHKTGDVFKGLKTEEKDGLQCMTPVFGEGELKNVAFEIIAEEDILDPADGSVIIEEGETADTTVTGTDGTAETKELPLGKYVVREAGTSEGYIPAEDAEVILDEKHADEISENGDIAVSALEMHNEYKDIDVSMKKTAERITTDISKEDGYEKMTNKIEESPAEGFSFGLFAAQNFDRYGKPVQSEEKDLKDVSIAKDTLVMTAVSGKDGIIKFSGTVPHGKYYVMELGKKEGYLKNDQKIEIDLTAEPGKETVTCDKTNDPFINRIEHDKVKITKKDITGSETLPGALVEVYNDAEEIVYRDMTDENGNIEEMSLEPGEYTFREILAPEGFEKKSDSMGFTVLANGVVDSQEHEFSDDYAKYSIRKTDEDGKALEGAVFGLYRDEELIMKQASAENGIATFNRIDNGEYEIKELEAPDGYEISDETVKISVDGTWVNQTDDEIKDFVNKKKSNKSTDKEKRKASGGSGASGSGSSDAVRTGDDRTAITSLLALVLAAAAGTAAAAAEFHPGEWIRRRRR